ncbi:phosphoribosyltransferase domain-containing protein [Psychrobacter sp. M13]|uniref:phosphoribosyltransferase domain-containing protein n=1 Tax=Psychrobacter sp. M13 TaxID=3067275 RepID=UPI00273AF0DB|nr:phosphoribosyltransferase domain-containing protein [Psychrobacter sp. M13]WLP93755.1 phosphoribosyltransferase domain-containing protein [Psychrobacter sp. M13]
MSDKQKITTITLPRGTLDLTYQTNNVAGNDSAYELEDLLGFAQRINPKRAFLFVSKVLGRHIPVAPSTMRRAFTDLASLVPDNLSEPILVIGMAETAVGLSAGVHQALQTRYPNALLLNSTRHAQHDETSDGNNTETLLTTFSEDHSHASQHLIYQSSDKVTQAQLLASKTVIMVDDEASTGNTCINVVTALRDAGLTQLEQVHLTTLVDWSLEQTGLDDTVSDKIASRLPNIDFYRHHLLSGAWQWTDAPNPEPITMPSVDTTAAGSQPILPTGNWGRFPTLDSTDGFESYLKRFKKAFAGFNNQVAFEQTLFEEDQLPKRILVLGCNEFVWLPFLLAEWLEQNTRANHVEHDIKFSALTRSPIALGGAITTMMSFTDNYGLGMTNFVYNVEPKDWDLIVLCVETPADSVDAMWQDLDNVLVVGADI